MGELRLAGGPWLPNTFFTAGWVALALQSSGYLAETFGTGIEAVPKGHGKLARRLAWRGS